MSPVAKILTGMRWPTLTMATSVGFKPGYIAVIACSRTTEFDVEEIGFVVPPGHVGHELPIYRIAHTERGYIEHVSKLAAQRLKNCQHAGALTKPWHVRQIPWAGYV